MQNKNKRLFIIEYFINKIGKNGILFLQERHSPTSDEGKWKDEFRGPVFYGLCSLGKKKYVLIVQLLTNHMHTSSRCNDRWV